MNFIRRENTSFSFRGKFAHFTLNPCKIPEKVLKNFAVVRNTRDRVEINTLIEQYLLIDHLLVRARGFSVTKDEICVGGSKMKNVPRRFRLRSAVPIKRGSHTTN